MSEANKAAAICPPVQGGVIGFACATSAKLIKIPDDWRDSWITIQANGAKVGYLLGDANVVANLATLSTIPSNEVTVFGAGTCKVVPDGQERHEDLSQILPKGRDLYISIDCDAATGDYRIIRSSGSVGAL